MTGTAEAHDIRARSLTYLTGTGQSLPRPSAVGEKFTADGRVLPFPGNTFLCHVPPRSAAHAALTAASAALQAGPQASAFTFLPPSSFHMTVFEGVCHAHRGADRWPQGIAPETPVEDVTQAFLPRVISLTLPVRQHVRPRGIFGGFSVALTGATPEDEASLRQARKDLADATGIHRASFADYDFHITLGYLIRWLTADEATAVMDLSDNVASALAAAAPVIDLGGVEFCRFDDMHAFPTLCHLS